MNMEHYQMLISLPLTQGILRKYKDNFLSSGCYNKYVDWMASTRGIYSHCSGGWEVRSGCQQV